MTSGMVSSQYGEFERQDFTNEVIDRQAGDHSDDDQIDGWTEYGVNVKIIILSRITVYWYEWEFTETPIPGLSSVEDFFSTAPPV